MSKIAGILDWQRQEGDSLDRFAALARGRSVTWCLPQLALFQAAESGVQMGATSTVAVAFVGYLYNADEVRQELRACGHAWETQREEELLQKAYLQWGPSFVQRLYGAFAFVLWDGALQRLILGRDQLGIQPLYFAQSEGVVLFASDLQDVLAHPHVSRRLDADGLAELFAMGPYFSPGQAVLCDVQEVPPAHLVLITPEGERRERYWTLQSAPHPDSFAETVERVRQMLEQNVAVDLRAQEATTVILSGGLDSSGLTAMAARTEPRLQTYSINTPASVQQEGLEGLDAPWVRRVAEHLQINNREVLVDTPDVLQALAQETLPDLPGQAEYDAMQYLVYKNVRQTHQAAILGEGADELFSSLPWFYVKSLRDRAALPWVHPFLHTVGTEALQAVEPYALERYQAACQLVPRLEGESEEQARLRELSYLTLQQYLPYLIRRDVRLTRAAQLEARFPFGDARLVQYVWNIPWDMKNYGGQKKGLLREVFRPYLPDDVVDRKKSDVPIVFNQSYTDFLQREVEAMIKNRQSPLAELLDADKIQALLGAGRLQNDMFWRFRLDYFVQVNRWLERNQVEIQL